MQKELYFSGHVHAFIWKAIDVDVINMYFLSQLTQTHSTARLLATRCMQAGWSKALINGTKLQAITVDSKSPEVSHLSFDVSRRDFPAAAAAAPFAILIPNVCFSNSFSFTFLWKKMTYLQLVQNVQSSNRIQIIKLWVHWQKQIKK